MLFMKLVTNYSRRFCKGKPKSTNLIPLNKLWSYYSRLCIYRVKNSLKLSKVESYITRKLDVILLFYVRNACTKWFSFWFCHCIRDSLFFLFFFIVFLKQVTTFSCDVFAKKTKPTSVIQLNFCWPVLRNIFLFLWILDHLYLAHFTSPYLHSRTWIKTGIAYVCNVIGSS